MGATFLFLALMLYSAMSGVPWLFLLGLWLLALVPAAFAYAVWNRKGVTLSLAMRQGEPAPGSPARELPDAVMRRSPQAWPVFEGDGFGLEIAFRALRGARGPVWAVGEMGGRKFGAGTGVVSREGWSRVRQADGVRRGVVRAADWHIGTSDPLGLFRGFRRLPDKEVGLVLPKFASLAQRRETREVEASVAAPRAGSGNELFGIREYRPGDSLRRIHWRSSARHGELVVREYEPPGVQTLVILVDPNPSTTEIADQVARIAASEAWDCLRESGRVVISGALETRDIWEVLEWLARYPTSDSRIPDSPDIVITADPELLHAGARRNWLVGDAAVKGDVAFDRVGTSWPL
jgi:uncharacterized protein (DUF58 family)